MSSWQTLKDRSRKQYLAVTAVPVGLEGDGVNRPINRSGTELDRYWPELADDFEETLHAYRYHPIGRRLIGICTAYVIGGGMSVESDRKELMTFAEEFWHHEKNTMPIRISDLSNELSRAGEIFLTLHTNMMDGMSYIRAQSACYIERIRWMRGDYETHLRYYELPRGPTMRAKSWPSQAALDMRRMRGTITQESIARTATMQQYGVNRIVGAIRGESDLQSLITYLRMYTGWLEDRVRYNAAIRKFLWTVKAPPDRIADLKIRYANPPEDGTIQIDEEDVEWQAVNPNLQARDAASDGRAQRWMMVAGGLGTSLIDLGEGEDSNLATARAMGEQRRRFMLQRQNYFAHILSETIVRAWNRSIDAGVKTGERATLREIRIKKPDISTNDNELLAKAAADLTVSLQGMLEIEGDTPEFRRFALETYCKMTEQVLTPAQFDKIIAGDPYADAQRRAPAQPQQPSNNQEQSPNGLPKMKYRTDLQVELPNE